MKTLTTHTIPTALALVALATTLPAQTAQPAPPPPQPKTYNNEESYDKAYIDSYKGTGHVNARPISVEAPQVDPVLLEEQTFPFNVKIEFTVDTNGDVKRPVIKSDTDFQIAQYVIDAIYDWRFKPAIHDGKPVAERMLLTLEFIDSDTIPAPSPGGAQSATPKGKKVASTMKLTPVATVASNN